MESSGPHPLPSSAVFTMRFATSDTQAKESPAPQTPPPTKRPRTYSYTPDKDPKAD